MIVCVCTVVQNKPIITIIKDDTVYHKANTPYVDQGATAMVILIDGTVNEDVPVKTVKNTVPPPLGQ